MIRRGGPTVVELVPDAPRVVPVGRLDADTTGALLLTNDGPLAHRLAHPRYEIEKVYEAEVGGRPGEDVCARLREGVELDDGITAPAKVRRVGDHRIELTIHEGRNRQVKRMFDAVGHPVRSLHRSVYAGSREGCAGKWRRARPWRELEPSRSGGSSLRRAGSSVQPMRSGRSATPVEQLALDESARDLGRSSPCRRARALDLCRRARHAAVVRSSIASRSCVGTSSSFALMPLRRGDDQRVVAKSPYGASSCL